MHFGLSTVEIDCTRCGHIYGSKFKGWTIPKTDGLLAFDYRGGLYYVVSHLPTGYAVNFSKRPDQGRFDHFADAIAFGQRFYSSAKARGINLRLANPECVAPIRQMDEGAKRAFWKEVFGDLPHDF